MDEKQHTAKDVLGFLKLKRKIANSAKKKPETVQLSEDELKGLQEIYKWKEYIEKVLKKGFKFVLAEDPADNKIVPIGKPMHFSQSEVDIILQNPELFQQLNYVDRYGFMQALGRSISKGLQVSTPDIYLDGNPKNIYVKEENSYNDETKNIKVNIKHLDNLDDLVKIIRHEVRHHWQNETNFEETPLEVRNTKFLYFKSNWDNGSYFRIGYFTAPDEADARKFEREGDGASSQYSLRMEENEVAECVKRFLDGEGILRDAEGQTIEPSTEGIYATIYKNATEYLKNYNKEREYTGDTTEVPAAPVVKKQKLRLKLYKKIMERANKTWNNTL